MTKSHLADSWHVMAQLREKSWLTTKLKVLEDNFWTN